MNMKMCDVLFCITTCTFSYFWIFILSVLKYKYRFDEANYIYTKLELKLHH
jgi:hypothetical protein